MGKGKLEKFADMASYENVIECPFSVAQQGPFDMKGHWRERFFHNNHPIVLELGCGKGEYTVGLAKLFPDVNFIGVDIKGARMWTGATQALKENLSNVGFLRTHIEIIDHFFAPDEVQEIWLPQMKNPRKRLTSTFFMERYRRFLVDEGVIHLKTDSNFLYTYTSYMVERNRLSVQMDTADLYHTEGLDSLTKTILSIQTYYESMWIERGLNIKYLRFQLPQQGELSEPDVEIPIDDYRSYRRRSRSGVEMRK